MQTHNENIKLANHALELWVRALETGNWDAYMSILSSDYEFTIPLAENSVHFIEKKVHGKWDLNQIRKIRVGQYKQEPSLVIANEFFVMYEFRDKNIPSTTVVPYCIVLILIFEIQSEKIKSCQEYCCEILQ